MFCSFLRLRFGRSRRHETSVQIKVQIFQSLQRSRQPTFKTKNLTKLFFFFLDPQEPEKISMDGVVRLLEDLQLDPGSKLVLLMAWKFQAAAQCEFSRDEFLNGMTELGYVQRSN